MKILIIEDDPGMGLTLRHFLEPLASNITIAKQMDEALKVVAEADELHLITVDLGLPDSDVRSTINRIRDIRRNRPESLIVVVTGQDIPGLETEALAHGADGYVMKQSDTFSSKGFLEVISALVAKFVAEPTHYNRSLNVLEKISSRLAEIKKVEASTPPATGTAVA